MRYIGGVEIGINRLSSVGRMKVFHKSFILNKDRIEVKSCSNVLQYKIKVVNRVRYIKSKGGKKYISPIDIIDIN